MINMSDTFKNKIYSSERYLEANVLINNGDYETDIIKDFKYHSSIAGNSFTIGSTNASTFEITLNKLVENLKENQEVKPYVGVVDSESVPLGVFHIQEIKLDRNAKITKIKCQDKMMYLNELYKTDLAFPAKIRDVIQDISDKVKMEFVSTHISYNKEVEKLEKVSYREMLSYLAQIEGCFVVFDRYGKLEFRKFNRTQEKITKNNYFLGGLEVNDVEYKLNGITADLKNKEKTILASGSAVGNQINLVNPLMKQDYLDEVYNYLKQFIFKPYTVNWQGNPTLEVGDFVQVEVANGQYIGVPILNLQINFSGGLNCKMSADVKTSTSTSYEYKGTIQKQIEFLNARIGADGTTIYADTKEPTNPKEGDTWFKPNGAYTDLYIYEKGQWLLKVSTGNIQELVTKITTDEVLAPKLSAGIAKIIELDASRITTGYLHAERLQAGSITERLISEETKQGLVKGLVSETKYNELVADNNNFKSGITEIITKEVSKVKVGVRNLLPNSYFFDKSKWHTFGAKNIEYQKLNDVEGWNDSESIKFVGRNTEFNSNILGFYLFDNLVLNSEKDYTLSFDCINFSNFDIKVFLNEYSPKLKEVVKSKEQKRVVLNAKEMNKIFVEVLETTQEPVFSIKKLKVEEGTIATTWVPALEDTQEENERLKQEILNLTTNNSELAKQLNNLELNNLQLKELIKSSIKQTKDSITFDFDKFKEIYQNDKSIFQGKFDDISSYIRFDIDGMEMGKKDGKFKMRLSPTKQSFYTNEKEVAYFSNEELYITDARILKSVRIGNFAFVPRENGNLSFRKVVD